MGEGEDKEWGQGLGEKLGGLDDEEFERLRRKAEAFADAAAEGNMAAAFAGLSRDPDFSDFASKRPGAGLGAGNNDESEATFGSSFNSDLHRSRAERVTKARQRESGAGKAEAARRGRMARSDDHSPELTPMPDAYATRRDNGTGNTNNNDDDGDSIFFDIGDNRSYLERLKRNLRKSSGPEGRAGGIRGQGPATFTVGVDGKVKFSVFGGHGNDHDDVDEDNGEGGDEEKEEDDGDDARGFGSGFSAGFMLAPSRLEASEARRPRQLSWQAPVSHLAFELSGAPSGARMCRGAREGQAKGEQCGRYPGRGSGRGSA